MSLLKCFSLFLFFYLSWTQSVSSQSLPCSSLKPNRVFSRNESVHECFYPLEYDRGPSCEIGQDNLNNFPRCVDNAKCVRNPWPWGDSSLTVCTCRRNFKMTGIYTCDPAKHRAEQCQARKIGQDDRFIIDNCDTGLHCVQGTCQCQLESDDGICLFAPGSPCSLVSSFNQTGRCSSNSICTQEIGSEWGTCKCANGYIGRGGQHCIKLLGPGENCDDSRTGGECSEILGLQCKYGTCQCELLNADNSNSCIIKIGRRCTAGGAKCPKYSTCFHGVCKCNTGFEEGDSGSQCQRLAFIGESCEKSDTKCDYTSGLTCTKGRCECRREKSADGKACVLSATDQCSIKNDKGLCPPNSICKTGEYSDGKLGDCRCNDGFISSYNDFKCHKLLGKGETCLQGSFQHNNFCNEKLGLNCVRNRTEECSCRFGESSNGKCKLQVGQRCELDPSYPACPPNSTCEGHGDYKNCKCLKNYTSQSDSLSCLPERQYMGTCGQGTGICSYGLTCLQGVCQCPTPSENIFDPESGKCKNRGRCEYDSDCPSRSRCKPLYAGSSTKWCNCDEGYTQDARSLCKSKYLTKCSKRDDCLISKSMDCIDGVCRCSAILNQIYDENQRECVSLLKSPCGTGNGKCVSSTYCSPLGVCVCHIGAIETETGICANLQNFGSNCTIPTAEFSPSCDWNKGLACLNGVCACVDPNLEYVVNNQKEGACTAKVGSLCNVKVPVGTCAKLKENGHENGFVGFETCNYYKIACESGSACQDLGNGLHRCRG